MVVDGECCKKDLRLIGRKFCNREKELQNEQIKEFHLGDEVRQVESDDQMTEFY